MKIFFYFLNLKSDYQIIEIYLDIDILKTFLKLLNIKYKIDNNKIKIIEHYSILTITEDIKNKLERIIVDIDNNNTDKKIHDIKNYIKKVILMKTFQYT